MRKRIPGAFEIIGSEEDDTFHVRAGRGCLLLSIAWLLVAAGSVALGIAKLVLK